MFVSTRGRSRKTFTEMLFTGFAEDGGILMPEVIPRVSEADLFAWRSHTFGEICFELLKRVCPESEIPHEVLRSLVVDVHEKTFGHADVITVVPLERGLSVAELFHGPTHAFKDLAMQVMGRLLNYVVREKQGRVTCLVNTTGDTGPSVLKALSGQSHIDVVVMFQQDRVSRTQRLQMVTHSSPNVFVIGTRTDADENDKVLRALFDDPALVAQGLTSINSINFGRILLAVAHYIFCYLRVVSPTRLGQERVEFAVPSGSFGNATAGFLAHEMGLPITLLIVNNENDVTNRLLRSGQYRPHTLRATLAPAIDCQVPYNLERVWWLLNRAQCARWSETVAATGELSLPPEDLKRLCSVFRSSSASDDDIKATIGRIWNQHRYLICPHTAVAVHGAYEMKKPENGGHTVVLATAHPSKFPEIVTEASGGVVPLLPFGLRFMRDPNVDSHQNLNLIAVEEPSVAAVENVIRAIISKRRTDLH